jgi:hypothetical protein
MGAADYWMPPACMLRDADLPFRRRSPAAGPPLVSVAEASHLNALLVPSLDKLMRAFSKPGRM